MAATDRFCNAQTSAQTMNVSADLMAAGANQQLVTSQLDHELDLQQPSGGVSPQINPSPQPNPSDGMIEMAHDGGSLRERDESTFLAQQGYNLPPPPPNPTFAPSDVVEPTVSLGPEPEGPLPTIHGVHGHPDESKEPEPYYGPGEGPTSTPSPAAPLFGSAASGKKEEDEESFDPMAPAKDDDSNEKLLSHDQPVAADNGQAGFPAAPSQPMPGAFDVPGRIEPTVVSPTPELPQPDFTSTAAPDGTVPSNEVGTIFNPVSSTPPAPNFGGQPAVAPDFPSTNMTYPSATPPPPSFQTPSPFEPPQQTLSDIEQAVKADDGAISEGSGGEIDVDAARNEVMRALSEQPDDNGPVQALNAQPLGDPLHGQPEPPMPQTPPAPASPFAPPVPQPPTEPPAGYSPADTPLDMPLPAQPMAPPSQPPAPSFAPPNSVTTTTPGNAPPPAPPPMMPPN